MKNEAQNKTWLLISSLILAFLISAVIPSVVSRASDLEINHSSYRLYTHGGRSRVQLKVYDEDGDKVSASWKSSRTGVATVSSSGVVTAKKSGTAKITGTYDGDKISCTVKVGYVSSLYTNAIDAYEAFLTRPYVTYTSKGAHAQADFFSTKDLNGDGIPELFAYVTSSSGYYCVLYHYTKENGISVGQILGLCSDMLWFYSKKIVGYRVSESNQSLYCYSKDNGTNLITKAIARVKNGKKYYYKSKGSTKSYGKKISALKFRQYVDRDLLGYGKSKPIEMYLNTPQNRTRYL